MSDPKQLKQKFWFSDIVGKLGPATIAIAACTPSGRTDMTPAQIKRVRRSFATVALNLDDVSDAFCKHLHRLDPSRGPVFDGDPIVQRIRVGGALAGLVGSLGQLDRVRPALSKLGSQRASQGVILEHYAMIEEALIAALREVLGNDFDAATERAWLLAYGQVVKTVTKGATDEQIPAQAA